MVPFTDEAIQYSSVVHLQHIRYRLVFHAMVQSFDVIVKINVVKYLRHK